jgi:hypothetical protein
MAWCPYCTCTITAEYIHLLYWLVQLHDSSTTVSFSCLRRRLSTDVQEGALFIKLLFLCHIFLVVFDNNICMMHMFMLEISSFTVYIDNVQWTVNYGLLLYCGILVIFCIFYYIVTKCFGGTCCFHLQVDRKHNFWTQKITVWTFIAVKTSSTLYW